MSGKHLYILLAGLALVDFVTDWFFVVGRFQGVDEEGIPLLSVLSAFFLGIPMLANFAFVVYFLRNEFSSEESSDWFFENSGIVTIVAIIAFGNPEVFILLISQTFGCLRPGSVFNAPFNQTSRQWLYIAGGIANVLEDLPQIGIQLAVMGREGASPLTTIALATSGVTLLFGVVRRLFLCIMFCRRREARLASRERSVAASEAASQAGANQMEMVPVRHHPQLMPTRTSTTAAASAQSASYVPTAFSTDIEVGGDIPEPVFTLEHEIEASVVPAVEEFLEEVSQRGLTSPIPKRS